MTVDALPLRGFRRRRPLPPSTRATGVALYDVAEFVEGDSLSEQAEQSRVGLFGHARVRQIERQIKSLPLAQKRAARSHLQPAHLSIGDFDARDDARTHRLTERRRRSQRFEQLASREH